MLFRLSLAKLLNKSPPTHVIAMRAIYKLSNPEEVQRIIRQQEQARDAEQRLEEALK